MLQEESENERKQKSNTTQASNKCGRNPAQAFMHCAPAEHSPPGGHGPRCQWRKLSERNPPQYQVTDQARLQWTYAEPKREGSTSGVETQVVETAAVPGARKKRGNVQGCLQSEGNHHASGHLCPLRAQEVCNGGWPPGRSTWHALR